MFIPQSGYRERPLLIELRSRWENGYSESFNGTMRDELLDREIFYTLREAQILIEWWRRHYNTVRPHSALGYRPPAPLVRSYPMLALPSQSELELLPAPNQPWSGPIPGGRPRP
jgi:putative transposase